MPLGFIKQVVVEKNFGFITPGLDSPDVFFHSSAAEVGLFERLRAGQPVEYEIDEEHAKLGQGDRARSVKRCRDDQVIPREPMAPVRRHPNARRSKPNWRR
jgi:cold shock CspA family protein